MKRNGFSGILIILVLSILGVVGYFVFKNNSSQTLKGGTSITTPTSGSDLNFKVISCNNCDVVRITQSVWNSPVTKAEADKVWEIETKMGAKTSAPDSEWTMEIVSVNPNDITVKFTGQIYKDLKLITSPVTLTKWTSTALDTGTAGGGTSWEVLYFTKTN